MIRICLSCTESYKIIMFQQEHIISVTFVSLTQNGALFDKQTDQLHGDALN